MTSKICMSTYHLTKPLKSQKPNSWKITTNRKLKKIICNSVQGGRPTATLVILPNWDTRTPTEVKQQQGIQNKSTLKKTVVTRTESPLRRNYTPYPHQPINRPEQYMRNGETGYSMG
jgi:hypothetical protein